LDAAPLARRRLIVSAKNNGLIDVLGCGP